MHGVTNCLHAARSHRCLHTWCFQVPEPRVAEKQGTNRRLFSNIPASVRIGNSGSRTRIISTRLRKRTRERIVLDLLDKQSRQALCSVGHHQQTRVAVFAKESATLCWRCGMHFGVVTPYHCGRRSETLPNWQGNMGVRSTRHSLGSVEPRCTSSANTSLAR
jgi:hypothetical protein